MLALVGLTDVFALFARLQLASAIGDDPSPAFFRAEDIDAADRLQSIATLAQIAAYVVCAIVFVVWFFLMRRYLGSLAFDAFDRGPGWAIGTWFIPLACLWMPYRIALEMWGAPTRSRYAEPARYPSAWPVRVWWGLFVLSLVGEQITSRAYDDAHALGEIRDAMGYLAVTDALDACAALAAAYFAVRLMALHRRPVAERAAPTAPAVAAP
ncbi:DUF4328 domain-containing protein [uncultured Streptomyces sp.]|uniref:DUF4328 domain-containing protein n=1 Tax=uncultured Streptomyces sp. TaxID=174707 RepID=UPI002638396D|nr:DUF4328 domain-containing protein [uncultured Streptomyces sp.]